MLDKLSEEEANEKIFIPLINDEHFFNLMILYQGIYIVNFMPLSIRFRPHDKREERKKREFKEDEVMHKAMDFYSNRKKGKGRRRHKRKVLEEEKNQYK